MFAFFSLHPRSACAMATPEDQFLPKPIDAEDGQLEILTVPRPLAVIPHSPEEIRQKTCESIVSRLSAGRMPLYPAIALPLCVLSSLASGGVAGFTLRVVTRNVSIYGFFPGTSIPQVHLSLVI